MKDEDLEVSGALVGVDEIQVAAPVGLVWDVLTGFETWPSWNPEVVSMSVSGPVAEGMEFRWKLGRGPIVSRVRQVDAPRRIVWTGRALGIRAEHLWKLEPRDGGTHVRTEESFDGGFARLFPGRVQGLLDKALRGTLEHLKAEAERRVIHS